MRTRARSSAARPRGRRIQRDAPADPGPADIQRNVAEERLTQLQRSLGNAAFARLMASEQAPASRDVVGRSLGSGAGTLLRVAETAPPVEKEAAPVVQMPSEDMLDRGRSLQVLEAAYGDYKRIKGGEVRVLSQAEFELAYNRADGRKNAWDMFVAPSKKGNLEGFTDKNVLYVNGDMDRRGAVDIVVHEMLHANASAAWRRFAGYHMDEGATEYLTHKAVKAAGYTPTARYAEQGGIARQLVAATSEELLIDAYFHGRTGPLKREMEATCAGSWRQLRRAMQAQDWTRALHHLDIVLADPTEEQLAEWGAGAEGEP